MNTRGQNLNVEPGGQVELDQPAAGRAELKAARPGGSMEDFFGLLAGQTERAFGTGDVGI